VQLNTHRLHPSVMVNLLVDPLTVLVNRSACLL
jgi:hypothetical protein